MPRHSKSPRSTPRTLHTLDDLTLDSRNANRGTDRGRDALAQSLRELGAGRAVLVDQEGTILAGNKTVERARALGLPLQVVQTDGKRLVAVQRTDLDLGRDAKARELAVADNRVGELDLAWDLDQLKALQADGLDLSAFWSPEEFAQLLDANATDEPERENAVVEPGPTTIRRGDLFALGDHRLLCGDATDANDVARLVGNDRPVLMATDPPYGVSYDPAWRHRLNPTQRTSVGQVANDDRAEWSDAFSLFTGPVAYVWHAALHATTVALALTSAGFTLKSQIIWRKQHFALSRGRYHWAHEAAWYAVRTGQHAPWRGDRTQTTVWDVPNLNPHGGTRNGENAVTGHGTQKPVRLFEIPIANHLVAGEWLYDPFVGSGSALIAAEKLGRRCLAMDLEPQYVQVALTRWETYSGAAATRLSRLSATSRRTP